MDKHFILALLAMALLLVSCATTPASEQQGANCDYSNPEKVYVGKSQENCTAMRIHCTGGFINFNDACGCGCKAATAPISSSEGKIKVTDCTLEQKQNNACTREYLPVCGWSDPAKIQCIRYPCAQTFGNKCEACANENVISWSEGECPAG